MSVISDQSKIELFLRSYKQIFIGNDPFVNIFKESVENRIILCPVKGYYLTESQYHALTEAAKCIGDNGIIISIVETGIENFNSSEHWFLKFPTSYEEYINILLVLENSIYSPSGRWGVIISHEEHAVLGSDSLFFETFKKFYPKWAQEKRNFLNMWERNVNKYGSNIDWMSDFLSYLTENE